MAIKHNLAHSSYVESIHHVSRTMDAKAKLSSDSKNVLLVDADLERASPSSIAMLADLQRRHQGQLLIVYTAANVVYATTAQKAGLDNFVHKPIVFTTAAAQLFLRGLCKHINTFLLRTKPPTMRDMVKMVTSSNNQKLVAIASSTGGTNA